VFKKIVF